MALTNYQQWWIRTDGNQENGGGFDASISGAGTNYSDQAAAQLHLTDLATTGAVAILTSVVGGFTAAMIGNIIQIKSGTNFTPGYYCIISFTDSNTVILDRVCATAAGISGDGKIGGAWATHINAAVGGSGIQPSLASPVLAGNTINVRGAGSDDSGTVDYDYSGNYGYWILGGGSSSIGPVKYIGYNGRPVLGVIDYTFYSTSYINIRNLKFKLLGQGFNGAGGMVSFDTVLFDNLIIDQNGNDSNGLVCDKGIIKNCYCKNTGDATPSGNSNHPAITTGFYGNVFINNFIDGWKGPGIGIADPTLVKNNIIINCGREGINIGSSSLFPTEVLENTIQGNALDGIVVSDNNEIIIILILNNIISNNGGYGINIAHGSTSANLLYPQEYIDFNDVYNNTSGNYNNWTAGAHDLSLDPQYVDAAAGNFMIGTNLKAKGYPATFLNNVTNSYMDIGAAQRKEIVPTLQNNSAFSSFSFTMLDSVTANPQTGLSVTAQRSLDGASFASCTNAVSENASSATYKINLSSGDLTATNCVVLYFTAAAALPTIVPIFFNRFVKNTAYSNFCFAMFDSAGAKTGLTVTATRAIDGAAFASCTNSVAEVGLGVYQINLSAADLNGNNIIFKFTATGANATDLTIITES